MMRWAWLAIVLLPTACGAEAFACGDDGQCMLGGEPGLCLAGSCAYPDAMCPSGYRYAAGLGSAFAGQCVADGDVPGSGTETEGSTSGSTSSTTVDPSTSASTTDTSTTTGSVEVSAEASPTTIDPFTTTDPATSMPTTGGPCDETGCDSCLACVIKPMEACSAAYEECALLDACPVVQECLQACVSTGACGECCTGVPDNAIVAALEVLACQEMVCQNDCMFPPLPCQ